MNNNLLFAVDPGYVGTGMVLLSDSKVFWHKTTPGKIALANILQVHSIYKFKRAAVEIPQESVLYRKYLYTIKAHSPEHLKFKICMDIGKNIGLSEEIIHTLEDRGVKVQKHNPVKGATKWDVEYWKRVFGWKEKRVPSQHARDAAILGLIYEKSVVWEL